MAASTLDVAATPGGDRARRTAELLVLAQRAPEAERLRLQDLVIELNLPIARSLARRFAERGQPLDDLEQAAAVGLVKAVRRFDPDRGSDFLTFAVPTITGEVKRHFRDCAWAVRPPRRIQEAQGRVAVAIEELTTRLRRSPTAAEVARHLDLDEEDVVEAMSSRGCFSPASLDAELLDGDGTALRERLGTEDGAYTLAETLLALQPALDRLDARDRRILQLRLRLGRTQSQIAAELGVSQMQVSRQLARIRATLRGSIA